MEGFYWTRHPNGPFATLIAVATTYLDPENYHLEALKELAKLTGWQPNSVRGFLSGAIGKKMGTPVESSKRADGERSYRLSSRPGL